MNAACSIAPDAALVPSLLSTVDCTTQNLLAGGYSAMAAPNGPVALAITSALTLYVGWFGIRLLSGNAAIEVSGLMMMAVKIGLVLVIAGDWPLYQQLVCKTLFETPAQLAKIMLSGFGSVGSVLNADPLIALQQAFDELARDVRSLSGHAGDRSPLLGGTAFATMALNAASYGLVFCGAGLLVVARLGLTLLLAIGPAVGAFLLFQATRGLVEGWLRVMIALSLVILGLGVLLPIELAMLEPTLIMLAQQRLKDAISQETAMLASFLIALFCFATIAWTVGAATIARGLRLPSRSIRRPQTANPARELAPRSTPALTHAERTAAALDRHLALTYRRAPRPSSAPALRSALLSGERHRLELPSGPAASSPLSQNHRASRPRRELLVPRRSK